MALLRGNYIGMHAAVMYRREIFDTFLFDETLPACEDYDLYLRIAKKYPVFSHNEKLAAYRMHSNNMSKDIGLMLKQVKIVLRKNVDLKNVEVKRNYKEGKKNWTEYYSREMYRRIAFGYLYPGYKRNLKDLLFVTAKMPKQMIRLFMHKATSMFKRNKITPKPGKVSLGDLRRTIPVSKEFGYDRGGPVDRYYIENFLKENSEYIRGNTLEIGDNTYTLAYGGNQVTQSDILYIDDSNPQATIIGDLSTADHIPSNQFECIVLTQTLHLIYDFRAAIGQCHRILKTGGTLLLTVPGITQIDYGEWGDTWYWSFTGRAIQRLLLDYFDSENLIVQTHGNVLAATAFLYGLGQKEITDQE
ncbi:MAG: methyltransferase domain-containing protein, partial [Chitinophagaceae bacterium]